MIFAIATYKKDGIFNFLVKIFQSNKNKMLLHLHQQAEGGHTRDQILKILPSTEAGNFISQINLTSDVSLDGMS